MTTFLTCLTNCSCFKQNHHIHVLVVAYVFMHDNNHILRTLACVDKEHLTNVSLTTMTGRIIETIFVLLSY